MSKELFGGKRNGFENNPQNINKTGENRKSTAKINKELKDKGVDQLTKSQIMEAKSRLLNCTDEDINELNRDKNTPLVIKIIIQELKNESTRLKAFIDFRDYTLGKAEEPASTINNTFNLGMYEDKTREELDQFRQEALILLKENEGKWELPAKKANTSKK